MLGDVLKSLIKRLWGRQQVTSDGLLSVLLDKSSDDLGGRMDAAMYLGEYDDVKVEEGLLRVVTDQTEDDGVADYAGESLLTILSRKKKRLPVGLEKLHPEARKFFDKKTIQ